LHQKQRKLATGRGRLRAKRTGEVNELRTWHRQDEQEEPMANQIIVVDGGSTIAVPSMEDTPQPCSTRTKQGGVTEIQPNSSKSYKRNKPNS